MNFYAQRLYNPRGGSERQRKEEEEEEGEM